jgi:hypothetical protein
MAINPIFTIDPHLTKDIDFALTEYDDFQQIVSKLEQHFPQIQLPDYDLDETLSRGTPYTVIIDKLKVDLFGKRIMGLHFTPSIESRCKSLVIQTPKGPITVKYLSDSDLLLFKLYSSLTSTKHFAHALKVLQLSQEIDWHIILSEAKIQDQLNLRATVSEPFAMPSVYSTILQIIPDLRKKGFRIDLDEDTLKYKL